MAYEVEAVAPDFASSTQAPVWRPERTVDFSEFSPPRKASVAASTPALEAKTQEQTTAATEAPVVTLSPAASALARKEQRFRKQQADFRAQEAALEQERKELAELRALKGKLDAKDYSAIESMVPYDAYTNYLINKNSPVSPEQEQIKQLSEKVSNLENAHKTDAEKRFEIAVEQRREAVKAIVESNPEFSSIKEKNAVEHVVRHIVDTFEEEGIELTPEQAAQDVENVILERAKEWSGLTKLKPKETPKEEPKKKEVLQPKPAVSTITHAMAATGDTKLTKPNYAAMRSDEERWNAARNRITASGETLKG